MNKYNKLAIFTFGIVVVFILLFSRHIDNLNFSATGLILIGVILTFLLSVTLNYYSFSSSRKYSQKEIDILYAENKSVIEQLTEAIISIDTDFNITTINKKSKTMFNLTDEDIAKHVFDVFPYIDFKAVINERKQRYNRLIKIDEVTLLVSYFPLYLDDEVIGGTAIFKSRIEVEMLLDQISGYQQISIALREQKHEFKNKLHVIMGLIKLKDYETVQNYITSTVYTTNLTSDYYSSRLLDHKISALFVGKEIQSKEFEVNITLTSDSKLTATHNPINSDDLIIVIGNLIDNSIEAYGNQDIEDKKIIVSIIENELNITILVTDYAGGIDPLVIDTMFTRGVSTKLGGNRGNGLSLVRQIVKLYSGEKHVDSTPEETNIEIILSKVKI